VILAREIWGDSRLVNDDKYQIQGLDSWFCLGLKLLKRHSFQLVRRFEQIAEHCSHSLSHGSA
jgi:hypothetical protein